MIIRQPNGKFALFSSMIDDFTAMDATEEELAVHVAELEYKKAYEHVMREIEKVKTKDKPYFQFSKTFDEALATIEDIHGKEVAKKRRDYLY